MPTSKKPVHWSLCVPVSACMRPVGAGMCLPNSLGWSIASYLPLTPHNLESLQPQVFPHSSAFPGSAFGPHHMVSILVLQSAEHSYD